MKTRPESLDFVPDNSADLRQAVIRQAGSMNFADWQFIKLIRALDRYEAWRHDGFCSLVGWLDYHCGLGSLAARERIRVGKALARLPRLDAAFRDGEISYSKVRAITRVAKRQTDELLLALAKSSSANELERLVRTYERTGGAASRDEAASHAARALDWRYEDGMVIITAALPAEQGAVVVQALQQIVDGKQAARDAYWEDRYASMLSGNSAERVTAETVSAETATDEVSSKDDDPAENVSAETDNDMTSSFEDSAEGDGSDEDDVPDDTIEVEANDPGDANGTGEASEPEDCFADLEFQMALPVQRQADALVDLAEHYLATPGNEPRQRGPGRRYEVVLHIDRDELAAKANQQDAPPRFYVEPGWGVDEAAARQIACEADIREFIQDDRGRLIDIKSRSRNVPPGMRRALEVRDGGCCRFPGCHHTRNLESHHVIHWINGGKTELDNLILLCKAHHRLHHLGQYNIHACEGAFTFVTRHGEVIEPTLDPQFPNVPAEMPAPCRALARPSARSPLKRKSEREVARIIQSREEWAKGRIDRIKRRLGIPSHDAHSPIPG